MKKSLLLLAVFIIVCGLHLPAHAEEDMAADHVYEFPEIEPEYEMWAGYRFTGLKGSSLAAEYEYMRDSAAFGGRLVAFPFPHRMYLELDWLNKKDNFADIRYAFADTIVFRYVRSAVFHNLPNITLVDLDPGTASPGVLRLDTGEDYGFRTDMNRVAARYKTHDFPFHIYMSGLVVNRKGDVQQRFLGGAGYFNNVVRVSERRAIDWKTTDFTFGANSHLGPVEVDISHTEKRFSSDNPVTSFTYTDAGFGPPGSVRPAGEYPHNVTSDLKGSTNTLKLHTSHTGKFTAAAALSNTDRENQVSGAEADYVIGTGSVRYMPVTNLLFSVKYKHVDADLETPDTLPADYLGFSGFGPFSGIKNSVSYRTDAVTGTIVYKPVKKLRLKATGTYRETDRRNEEEWGLPGATREAGAGLAADYRVRRNLKLSAGYAHKEIDNPAYNTQPSRADEVSLSVSWSPVARVNTFISYRVADEERRGLHFVGLDPTAQADRREADKQKLVTNVTVAVLDNFSVNAGFAYWRNKVEQDLVYQDGSGNPQFDEKVEYRDIARNYTLGFNYTPVRRLDISGAVSYTQASTAFFPDADAALQPVSIASFSKLKITETALNLNGRYELAGGFALGLDYYWANYEDKTENPENPFAEDGEAQIVLISLSKRW